jgi:hypothetical protein
MNSNMVDLPRETQTVIINPKKNLSSDMIGQPVDVRFDLFGGSFPSRTFDFVSKAVAETFHHDAPAGQAAAQDIAAKETRP